MLFGGKGGIAASECGNVINSLFRRSSNSEYLENSQPGNKRNERLIKDQPFPYHHRTALEAPSASDEPNTYMGRSIEVTTTTRAKTRTDIKCLNFAVPDHIVPNASDVPRYSNVIVNTYTFGPQGFALFRRLFCMIFQRDRKRSENAYG